MYMGLQGIPETPLMLIPVSLRFERVFGLAC